ncbi:tyrosine-type recombinase/integrase [Serratia quinivorans]|uniref:tyrosine-type recombinase/integrase n=1 Tax=Serratia quinivorans TaxID=137545 RepID=UPI00217A9558|nr:tyrosine-type recombinase/integrase [Serratia quinivorans]CAI1012336.1 Tyrosine recombinase XerD [Serratia quinivorans]CAI1812560.1 Tyrosine recombinase XerD [Serratia quinivorans]
MHLKNRHFLTQDEVERILLQSQKGNNKERNYCMLLICYIHGLRVSELTGLKLTDLDTKSGVIYIRRLKNGFSTAHPISTRVINAIKTWLPIRNIKLASKKSPYLFPGRESKMLARQTIYIMIKKYAEQASLNIQAHPHMLRHACGYELANQGMDTRLIQDYLGHRNISHTVIYTASNPERFRQINW